MSELTPKYSKSSQFEKVLDTMNETLFRKQKELFSPIHEDKLSCHIIGAPRSGTTLLTQLMISHLDLGYINNFIAAYWKAPIFGIHLSNQLLGQDYQSNFKSDLGRTNQILEPHEFGYFWKYHLNYTDFLQKTYNNNHEIKWGEFKEILYQMIKASGKPMLFKSFLLGFHAQKAVNVMPKTVFIMIKRNLIQNAYSILMFRKKLFGDETVWASMKPSQYEFLKNENIYRQVIGQVLFLNHEYEKQLISLPLENVIELNYSNLCEQPIEILNMIQKKIRIHEEIDLRNLESLMPFKENLNPIPSKELIELEKAKNWVLTKFTELNKHIY